MLSLLAVFAVGAVASGSALAVTSAPCYQVAEVGTGQFSDAHCLASGGSKEYVKVKALVTRLKAGEWCAEVTTAATGNYENNTCTTKVAAKEFIKVKVPEWFECKNVGAGNGKFETSTCEKEAAPKEFEWKPIEAAQVVTVASGETTLEGEIGNLKVLVKCATDKQGTAGVELEPAGGSKGEIAFETCGDLQQVTAFHKLESVTNCKVSNILFKFRDQLVPGEGVGPEEEFKTKEATSNVFVTIELTGGSCTLPKTEKVEVSAANAGIYCQLPEYPVAKLEREVSCSSSGDENLRFAGKKASFFGTEKVTTAKKVYAGIE